MWNRAQERVRRSTQLRKTAIEMGLGQPLTDEFTDTHEGEEVRVQLFELGLLYQTSDEIIAVPDENDDEGLSVRITELPGVDEYVFIWDARITGFSGTYREYYETFLEGKLPGLTRTKYRMGLMKHNPHLIEDGGKFDPAKTYVMPRYFVYNIKWDAEMTGFSGTCHQYWNKFLRSGKVLGLSRTAFLAGVVMHNPYLIELYFLVKEKR
ncbi:hypothetical protein KFU94_61560 [Chloroflexi bacterium TSY]|nr:hypothetical protein [Chloroflexi bacterium TSY]